MAFVSPRSLSKALVLTFVPTAALLATGCKTSSPSSPPAIASAACMDPSAAVVITDETNYSLTDSFSISHTVMQNNYDLVFDWSQLTVDFFGKAVNPTTDINTVSVSLWNLTPPQIEEALKVDNLPLTSNSGVITNFPDGTYTHIDLLNFNELGQPLPVDQLWSRFDVTTPNYQYPQDQYTFLVMAQSGADVGKQPHSIALFNLDTNSTTTQLNLTNDSTKLSYSVDLWKGHPMLVPTGVPAVTIDWSQMTTNCLGNYYDGSQITEAAVAHYANKSLADLQSEFLNLEDIADGWWSSDSLGGRTVDLSTLTDKNGATFPGIDDNGVWMAALFCGNCNNPAPWSITILEPCK
jgi:hypothetical protein